MESDYNTAGMEIEKRIQAMIMARDERGLELFLREYGGKIRGFLANRPSKRLNKDEVEEVLTLVTQAVWYKIEQFCPAKGTLAAWANGITRHKAADVLREQKKARFFSLKYEPACPKSVEKQSGVNTALIRRFQRTVRELGPKQQAIVQADLGEPNCTAPAAKLAKELGSTEDSIYVMRCRARAHIRRRMQEPESHSSE